LWCSHPKDRLILFTSELLVHVTCSLDSQQLLTLDMPLIVILSLEPEQTMF